MREQGVLRLEVADCGTIPMGDETTLVVEVERRGCVEQDSEYKVFGVCEASDELNELTLRCQHLVIERTCDTNHKMMKSDQIYKFISAV